MKGRQACIEGNEGPTVGPASLMAKATCKCDAVAGAAPAAGASPCARRGLGGAGCGKDAKRGCAGAPLLARGCGRPGCGGIESAGGAVQSGWARVWQGCSRGPACGWWDMRAGNGRAHAVGWEVLACMRNACGDRARASHAAFGDIEAFGQSAVTASVNKSGAA